MFWDWSTAGQDLPENEHEYLKIKGSFIYEGNIIPSYDWYAGTAERYLLGDSINPDEVTKINDPIGSIADPASKIWPFKVHTAKQIYDSVNNYLLVPKTVGEGGYWTEFDWDLALQLGSEQTGLDYSGEYGFTETEMYWPITHMVAPSEQVLQCTDCHSANGRLDWGALGYLGDPMRWGGGSPRQPTRSEIQTTMNAPAYLSFLRTRRYLLVALAGGAALAAGLLALAARPVAAQTGETTPVASTGSPLHPTFPLLDAGGENVLTSAQPVSTMKTCGACHDTAFIAGHSFHTDVGLSDLAGGAGQGFQPWDSSPGLFGRWDPLTYRYLSPEGDERIDLTTAEWLQTLGLYHAGGGPAETGRGGAALTALPEDASPAETSIIDPVTGETVPWDWQASGTVEMNCFLCHLQAPNNEARSAALQAGDFAWANTATLTGTGIVEETDGIWAWNADAFDAEGALLQEYVTLQDPSAGNCGQCHGQVHTDNQTPLAIEDCSVAEPTTATTGQVFAAQVLLNSGANLADKQTLSRSFDVHAERAVECVNCHFALNNPVYYAGGGRPLEH